MASGIGAALGWLYILGARLRRTKEVRDVVLSGARRVLGIVRRSFGRSTNRWRRRQCVRRIGAHTSPSGTLRSAPRAEANGCHVMGGPCA